MFDKTIETPHDLRFLEKSIRFSNEQKVKFSIWNYEQNKIVIEEQKGTEYEMWGLPYYGAIGGSLTFKITVTSIGVCVSVKHNGTKEEIDLTEYDKW